MHGKHAQWDSQRCVGCWHCRCHLAHMASCTHGANPTTSTMHMMPCAGECKVRGGGTLHHMSPELVNNYVAKAQGLPSVYCCGMGCDMWAAGIVIVEMLTGDLPFWPKDGYDYVGMQGLQRQWVSSTLCMSWTLASLQRAVSSWHCRIAAFSVHHGHCIHCNVQ